MILTCFLFDMHTSLFWSCKAGVLFLSYDFLSSSTSLMFHPCRMLSSFLPKISLYSKILAHTQPIYFEVYHDYPKPWCSVSAKKLRCFYWDHTILLYIGKSLCFFPPLNPQCVWLSLEHHHNAMLLTYHWCLEWWLQIFWDTTSNNKNSHSEKAIPFPVLFQSFWMHKS